MFHRNNISLPTIKLTTGTHLGMMYCYSFKSNL